MPINIFTTIDDPSANSGTVAESINGSGQIVGFFTTSGLRHGFVLSGGSSISLDDPSTTSDTRALGINDAGQIVGIYNDGIRFHGFLFGGGNFITLADPSATTTTSEADGINDQARSLGTTGTPAARMAFS